MIALNDDHAAASKPIDIGGAEHAPRLSLTTEPSWHGVPIHLLRHANDLVVAGPRPGALSALCRVVRDEGCDVGFAQDMDADRLAVVSEEGEPIGEELTLILATQQVLVTFETA